MDLYFYTGRLDLAATSLTDLQALIAALADQTTTTNAATIDRVTGKVGPLIQSDSGEALNLYFYSSTSTVASWVSDTATTLALGLGYADANTSWALSSTTQTSIVSGPPAYRTATLALNTTRLRDELAKFVDVYGRARDLPPIFLQIRKTTAGVSETVARLRIQVQPGVLTTSPSDDSASTAIDTTTLLASAVLNKSGLTSLTGGGSTALDGLSTAPGANPRHPVGCVVLLSYGLISQLWKLVSGTDAEDPSSYPAIVRPDDYDATTNPVVWKQIG